MPLQSPRAVCARHLVLLSAIAIASALFVTPASVHARRNDPGQGKDGTSAAIPRRIYVAARLAGKPPQIDGRIEDKCWNAEGTWSGDYTEYRPNHAVKPEQPTELKVLFDDKYIYVAIRAHDSESRLMSHFAGGRDSFIGDIVGIAFDSYFDHRQAFEFNLTSAGQKIDLTLSNSGFDTTWNPVWDGKVSHDDNGWSAEMRIPLNQLRYNDRKPQVWGMHAWRSLARHASESQWQLLPNDGTGAVYSFGELHGLELPKPRRHLELVPYVSSKLTLLPEPDARGKSNKFQATGGADAKFQLSTAFTLDATVNPDFGQVEADPSEMNLSAFETFLSERRPFFIEGRGIFSFNLTDDQPLFYSRRIGQRPSLDAPDGAYDAPEQTSILGAWKVTGKSTNGLSLGVLHAVTDEEHVRVNDENGDRTLSLEPAAQYAVVRAQQFFNETNTMLGGIVTAATRSLETTELRDLVPEKAFVGGLDFEHFWDDRTYWFSAKAIGTHVGGSTAAIADLQKSSARYFQRPDADYVSFDPSRTQLDGWGASIGAGKGSKGNWRYHEKLTAYSPGVEFNEVGYLRQADQLQQHTEVSYVEKEPSKFYREYAFTVESDNVWNYGGEFLRSSVGAHASTVLKNKAWGYLSAAYASEGLDPSALRGGPALRVPPWLYTGAYVSTDIEQPWWGSLSAYRTASQDGAYRGWRVSPQVRFRPTSALSLSLAASKSESFARRHWVEAVKPDGTNGNVMASMRSDSLSFTARAQWFIKPEFSVQYYGSPFGSSASFSEFQEIVDPRARAYEARARYLPAPRLAGTTYRFDRDGDGSDDYTLEQPDFSFGQFRSNLVVRWEFRPGSNLYVVWSQDRSESVSEDSTGSAIVRRLAQLPDTNVLLIKCSYWFSL